MNNWGAIVLMLAAATAFAGQDIPDPPDSEQVTASTDSLWRQRRLEQRVLEPCDRETWKKSAVVPEDLIGFLRRNIQTKSLESYHGGGTDFVLYLDTELCDRVFPVEANDTVRQQLVAAEGKLVRVSGRWAPTVRCSAEQIRSTEEDWQRMQHPVDGNGKIPNPPTTWGGGFIADRIEELPGDESEQPDRRFHIDRLGVGWLESATRQTRASGVLTAEEQIVTTESGELKIPRFWLSTDDGRKIALRAKLGSMEQTNLSANANRSVTIFGRWVRFVTVDTSEVSAAVYGPILKPHPINSKWVIAGGGIAVDRIETVPTATSNAPEARPTR